MPSRLATLLLTLIVSSATAAGEPTQQLLGQADRIVFLGDSITFGGRYVACFDAWLLTRNADSQQVVINVGLPSETVSGLSEEGHAGGRFPRPDLAERLQRVLNVTRPDLVFACYGINCGIYQPFDEHRFSRYQQGIYRLKQLVHEAGAKLVIITPPFYDDRRSTAGGFSYDAVLQRYTEWLLAQRQKGWLVVDLHGPMAKEVAHRRQSNADFTFQPDAVHPDANGHWFIAGQIIRWFGDTNAASAALPEAMLADAGLAADVFPLVIRRCELRRDAYLTAAGHKRPGVKAGLPLEEAERQAEQLTERIRKMAAQ
jgi:lysophospholipase L1-like esterase